jgi:hypothetical protein
MTLRTATYDDTKFKIVPLEPTIAIIRAMESEIKDCAGFFCGFTYAWRNAIAAAPEYQDTCTDGGKCGAGGYCENCTQEPVKDE